MEFDLENVLKQPSKEIDWYKQWKNNVTNSDSQRRSGNDLMMDNECNMEQWKKKLEKKT